MKRTLAASSCLLAMTGADALPTPAEPTERDHRRLDQVATGGGWSGFTDLYYSGSKSFDVKGDCGSSYLNGLHVLYDYESSGDIDRYNFELICKDGSRVDIGPYDKSKDAADWASPNGESTVTCPGGTTLAGLWGDRWRNESGDKDTFEFGVYCRKVNIDLCALIPPGVPNNCQTPPEYEDVLIMTDLGHSGATRAEGSAKCSFGPSSERPGAIGSTGLVHPSTRAVKEVNFVKYRKSNGDWDSYDFQVKCG